MSLCRRLRPPAWVSFSEVFRDETEEDPAPIQPVFDVLVLRRPRGQAAQVLGKFADASAKNGDLAIAIEHRRHAPVSGGSRSCHGRQPEKKTIRL